ALLGPSGTVVERYKYDAFGNTTLILDGATGNHYRFHGMYFDDETGFYFMRARYYIPPQGRFLQRDPIGVWEDEANVGNGYTLASNDAVNGTDSYGLDGTTEHASQNVKRDAEETERWRTEMVRMLTWIEDDPRARTPPD